MPKKDSQDTKRHKKSDKSRKTYDRTGGKSSKHIRAVEENLSQHNKSNIPETMLVKKRKNNFI